MESRKIEWEYEDSLDMSVTEEMFKASRIIHGVRMYPYILIEMTRYYLEGEH